MSNGIDQWVRAEQTSQDRWHAASGTTAGAGDVVKPGGFPSPSCSARTLMTFRAGGGLARLYSYTDGRPRASSKFFIERYRRSTPSSAQDRCHDRRLAASHYGECNERADRE